MSEHDKLLQVLREVMDECSPRTRMRLVLQARVIRANGPWFNKAQPMLPVAWDLFDVLCGDPVPVS